MFIMLHLQIHILALLQLVHCLKIILVHGSVIVVLHCIIFSFRFWLLLLLLLLGFLVAAGGGSGVEVVIVDLDIFHFVGVLIGGLNHPFRHSALRKLVGVRGQVLLFLLHQ